MKTPENAASWASSLRRTAPTGWGALAAQRDRRLGWFLWIALAALLLLGSR
jgi:hypothetical protein